MTGISGRVDAAESPHKRPNIVYFCSDQHARKYTGYAGHPLVQSPNLDRIARQGTVFTSAYCGSPVCVPGRACLMTGVYPSDCNSFCNSTLWDGSHPTWGTRLTEAGYYCRAIGKLDLDDAFDLGFEEVDTSHGHKYSPDITSLFRRAVAYRIDTRPMVDGHPRDTRHTLDARKTATAVDFITREAGTLDRPWALHLGLSQPHPRFVALQKYYDLYPLDQIDLPDLRQDDLENLHLVHQALRHFKLVATPIAEDRIRRAQAGYYGMITELDEYIGNVYTALEQTGQLDNTFFIYTSDHGESLGEHGMWNKNNLYENAAHIPLVIAGPGVPSGQTIDTPVAHVDLIATMLDLAGQDRPTELRGHSLLTMLNGDPGDHPGFAYTENHSQGNCTGSFMIRKGDWKYIHFTWYDNLLFNLKEDPDEFDNRIDDLDVQNIVHDLKTILHSQVDSEEVTRRAFDVQDRFLQNFAADKTETKLAAAFESRMGKGLAGVLAAKVKAELGD